MFGGAGHTVYLFEEDAVHFHRVRKPLTSYEVADYEAYKAWCDDYFHQACGERRALGACFRRFAGPEQAACFFS